MVALDCKNKLTAAMFPQSKKKRAWEEYINTIK